MQWRLGLPSEILSSYATDNDKSGARFFVTITADGPAGPVPTNQYVIDLYEYWGASQTATGTPLSIVKAINESTKSMDTALKKIADRLPNTDSDSQR